VCWVVRRKGVRERELRSGWPRGPECLACGRKGVQVV
jgi:hypothetical protein